MRGDMARIMPELNIKLKARFEAYNTEKMFETENSKSVHTSDDWHKFLDTPQGQTDLLDDNYLTNVSKIMWMILPRTAVQVGLPRLTHRLIQVPCGILKQKFVID